MVKNRINHTLIAPYHPHRGESSKNFKTLFNKFNKGSLSTRISRLLYHYRTTVQSSINKTPAEVLFNRKLRSLLDVFKPEIPWSKKTNSNNSNSKFVIGEAVFAKNFGKGPEWLAGTVVEIVNPLNYKIKFDCDANVIFLRHASQLFTRQLVNSENQDVPTLVDDNVKLIFPNKTYSENRNVSSKDINQSINSDNSENVEISDVPEVTEPVVNIPTNNDPITVSNKSGYRTRSGRMSKPPVKLNLYLFVFFL